MTGYTFARENDSALRYRSRTDRQSHSVGPHVDVEQGNLSGCGWFTETERFGCSR